jgi:hypothetical protein
MARIIDNVEYVKDGVHHAANATKARASRAWDATCDLASRVRRSRFTEVAMEGAAVGTGMGAAMGACVLVMTLIAKAVN